VPSPMNPPSGCPFHPRCPEAMAQCKDVVPKKINTGTAEKPHLVRCHLYSGANAPE
jgi:oligopeptide/dipeptide ABC transporter ATP-binding protein